MKQIIYIALISIGCFSGAKAQDDTLIIPPTKIMLKSNLNGFLPNYAFHYARPNVHLEYYAGKDISVGFGGGTYFLYQLNNFPFQHVFQANTKMTNVFGGFFHIDFKRYFGNKELSKYAHVLFPFSQLQYNNTKAENTGYYVGINLSEEFINVFSDVYFGQSKFEQSKTFFTLRMNVTLGYQSISAKGWVIDQTLGVGFTKGDILNQSLIEYNLFRNIRTDIYPNISYSLKFGKEFVKEFKVKERD
jgi:hypothetical protein